MKNCIEPRMHWFCKVLSDSAAVYIGFCKSGNRNQTIFLNQTKKVCSPQSCCKQKESISKQEWRAWLNHKQEWRAWLNHKQEWRA